MNRLAITPATVVTCNDAFETIDAGAVHIEGGRIVYVGPAATAPDFAGALVLGGSNMVALPGLINTHTHAAMSLLRGYGDDMALLPWLRDKIWPLEAHLTSDDVYWGTLLAALEMIAGGTTCCADMYHLYFHGTRALVESGLRACPGGVLLGFLPDAPRRIANAVAFARDFRDAAEGRITPFLAPHSLYTCDREQWQIMIAGARELGLPLHTHLAETRSEVAEVEKRWGTTPIVALAEMGALEGPFLGAHCNYLSETDLELMAASQHDGKQSFKVAHNPTSNMKLASGFAPVPELMRRSITVGLGTDGAASNNDLDMWEEMRLAALIHKGNSGDPTVVAAREALLMATSQGARCLGLESEIGSLEVGKKADLILIDFDKPHLTPRHNVVSHLVYAAKAADVYATVVDGQLLYRNGTHQTLDAPQIMARAQQVANRLVAAVASS